MEKSRGTFSKFDKSYKNLSVEQNLVKNFASEILLQISLQTTTTGESEMGRWTRVKSTRRTERIEIEIFAPFMNMTNAQTTD